MRRRVMMAAGNMLTPLGSLEETWCAIRAGRSGLTTGHGDHRFPDYPLGLVELEGLDISDGSKRGSWLRLEKFMDYLLAEIPPLAAHTRLILSSTKGAVDELSRAGEDVSGQPWQLGQWICNRLGMRGPALSVSGACASGTIGIIRGAMEIASGRADQVLVIGVDLVADFILAGFDSLKALSQHNAKPFDRNRDGLSLGEAGAWVLLAADDTSGDSTDMGAEIRSWAISCDATHITAPCRKASGLKRVLDQIITSCPEGRFVGGINGHGTGTVYNDAMELLAFNSCLPDVSICSTKGALGHSLGATGVVEALLSMKSLESGLLPPTVGCMQPADDGEMITAGQASLLAYPSVLSCNSGFGGINAGLLLTSR